MKKLLLVFCFVLAVPLQAQETRMGNLMGQPTFDRAGNVSYSIDCDASFSYQYINIEYMVFTIYSTVEEPLRAYLACSSDDDSYMLLYCDGFDPANPTANLVAGDDDDGDYYGGTDYSSAFTPDDDYVIHPYTFYKLVVTAYDSGSLSNFALTLYGNAHFLAGDGHPVITASADTGGSIDPAGEIQVPVFSSRTFRIQPNAGYHTGDVIVDGAGIGPRSTYKFEIVVENHTINATFIKNIPPVITSFAADKESGLAPMTVHFNVSAYDPDGGNITQYKWDFNGDGVVDQISTAPSADHRFVTSRDFPVTVTVVDDEEETTTSEVLTIAVAKPESINLPLLTDAALKKGAKSPDLHADTWAVDPFDEDATVVLTAMNDNDEQVAQTTMIIPGHGKAKLALSAFDGLDYSVVKVHPDRYLIYFTDVTGNNSRMASYIRTPLKSVLSAPHIAEETEIWDTYAFLSDENPGKLDLKLGTQTMALTPQYVNMLDLGQLAQENLSDGSAASMWSKFISYANNPFSDTSLMTGFEMFIKHGGDGAATELAGTGSTKLYIPHIPGETDIFWTGFAFVNPGQEDVTATATFYSDAGVMTGTSQITVPANSKIKGLMSDIFANAGTGAAWGTVDASGNLVGLEIYGTTSGICGFSLKGETTTEGVFPLMVTGENNWTGVALANPNSQEAAVTIDLVQEDGAVVATQTATIAANGRFSFVAADYFSRYNLKETDYIRFHSQYGLLGVEAGGDNERTFMVALDGEN